jgi:peptidyl-prolyl cis-trans isomerase SurA
MKQTKLFLIVTLFITLTTASLQAAQTLERLEGYVNNLLIYKSDFQKFRKTFKLRQQLDPLFGESSLAKEGVANLTDAEIKNYLINEKVILSQFPINDAEVDQEINSIMANNKLDRTQLKKLLASQGFGFDDYFELIRIGSSKRNLIDRDIRSRISLSEDEVRHYYETHYNKGKDAPRAFQLKMLTVSPKNYKSAAAAKTVIQRALRSLQTGESFDDVVKRVSDDPSASSGGDIGTLNESQLSDSVVKELKKLKPESFTSVIKNKDGRFMILKLIGVSDGVDANYQNAANEIRMKLGAEEYVKQIDLWIEKQKQSAVIHITKS